MVVVASFLISGLCMIQDVVYGGLIITAVASFVLLWSGTARELHTDLKPTLCIALVQVSTTMRVVGGIGEGAEEPDTSKTFCHQHNFSLEVAI